MREQAIEYNDSSGPVRYACRRFLDASKYHHANRNDPLHHYVACVGL